MEPTTADQQSTPENNSLTGSRALDYIMCATGVHLVRNYFILLCHDIAGISDIDFNNALRLSIVELPSSAQRKYRNIRLSDRGRRISLGRALVEHFVKWEQRSYHVRPDGPHTRCWRVGQATSDVLDRIDRARIPIHWPAQASLCPTLAPLNPIVPHALINTPSRQHKIPESSGIFEQ